MTSTVMGEKVRIVEKRDVKHKNPIVVEGLPDVGLVGTIAASYIVERMGYKEIGYIESDLFPPVMVVHEGKSKNPLRIYGDEGVVVVLSEVAIPVGAVYPLTEALADWVKEIDSKLVISMTGLPATNRIDIEKPEVFAVGNSEEALNGLKDKQMELLEEGFIADMVPGLHARRMP